jgi:hypothetical protein
MTTIPADQAISIYQGATFNPVLTFYTNQAAGTLLNLTGYTARMKARAGYGTAEIFNLTTSNGGITLGGAAGTVSLLISAANTAALTAGSYLYDLELIDSSGVVNRVLQGRLTVVAGITL